MEGAYDHKFSYSEKIAWFNATDTTLILLEHNEKGSIHGFLNNPPAATPLFLRKRGTTGSSSSSSSETKGSDGEKRFSLVKKVETKPACNRARFLPIYNEGPKLSVVDRIVFVEHQPANTVFFDLESLPGRTYMKEKPTFPLPFLWKERREEEEEISKLILVVNDLIGEHIIKRASFPGGGGVLHRYTPTLLVSPDTGPESLVLDRLGQPIGILRVKFHGMFNFVPRHFI